MANLYPPQATSSVDEWLTYLENLHGQAIDLGLERVRQVASHLNLLKPAPFIFTVGGTNGKGTTCKTLETLLLAAGYRVGVYSSPHLIRYTERVRIQGEELSPDQHTASFGYLNQARGDVSLTYFEFSTLSALHLFKEADLDVVVLEVGLGGRLDATNIIDADVAVITSVALDHTDWLGPDRESIGREKAGIFREARPAIVGEPDMPHSLAQVANDKGAILLARDKHWSFSQHQDDWDFSDIQGKISDLPLPQVPLANAATALAALRVSGLQVSEQCLRNHLAQVVLAGRFQIIWQSPLVILDVAHNPHAAGYLSGQLQRLNPAGKILAVVGMLQDKDIAGTLTLLDKVVDLWFCAPLDGPRGAGAEALQAVVSESVRCADVVSAWQAAIAAARPQDLVLVCGSFHTVAQVMTFLAEENGVGK